MAEPIKSDPLEGMSIMNPHPQLLEGPKFLHELVAEGSSKKHPAIDYLVEDYTQRSLTYTELHRFSDNLTRRIIKALHRQPAQGQPVVSLLIPQSPELYLTELAILKAGAAFCPLNLDAPEERIKFILQDVQATVVVTTPEYSHKFEFATEAKPSNLIVLTVTPTNVAQLEPESNDTREYYSLKPTDLAYVLYTSGSSGTPKGVGVPHVSAVQSLLAHERHIPPFSRFLQFAAPTFDVSVFEIFFPLYRGQTLIGVHRPHLVNDLPACMRKMNVDACELTPTVAGSWLRTRAAVPGLKLLLTIGEMLTERVISEFGGSEERETMLWAMYGPTEAAIHCSLQPAFPASSVPGNIGIPLDTVSLFVIEPDTPDFKPVPLGTSGELAIGGHQLARGYLNNPIKTAETFVSTAEYGIVYKTGDKATLHASGLLECQGRMSDGQVKLRGQRVELGEVEQVAVKAEACHSAVALVANNNLVLYCATDNEVAAPGQVLEVCKQWLPSFMAPSVIVAVKEFPRLPSGKVDRKAIRTAYLESLEKDEQQHAGGKSREDRFLDPLHETLYHVTEKVLTRPVPSTASLTAAGIDSLIAVRLASELRENNVEVGAIEILGCRDLLSLHSLLAAKQSDGAKGGVQHHKDKIYALSELDMKQLLVKSKIDFHDVEKVTRCTDIQASMLYGSFDNTSLYTNWVKLQFPASATAEDIEGWIRTLAEHNDMLRSGFIHDEGKFYRVVWKAIKPSQIETKADLLQFHIVSDDKLDAWLLCPFFVQIHPTAKGCEVLVHIHHSLYDGWSFDILVNDLSCMAAGKLLRTRPSYDRVLHFYSQPNIVASTSSLQFWADHLLGYQPPTLPSLRHTFVTSSPPVGVATKTLTHNVKSALTDGTHPQALFQAAAAYLWANIIGTSDIAIGIVTSGRMVPVASIEDVFGPCLGTLPLRIKLSESRTVSDLVESIHRGNRRIVEHSSVGLAKVKSAVGIAPGSPLFDLIFVYQQSLGSAARGSSEIRELDRRDFVEAKLLLEVEPVDNGYNLRLTFQEAFVEPDMAQQLLEQLNVVVGTMIKAMDEPLDSLQLTDECVLAIANPQPSLNGGDMNLAEVFTAGATKFPQRVALSFLEVDGQVSAITFKELNNRADQVAAGIKRLAGGGKSKRIVAVVMEKSVDLYVGILAIIKSGYGYLPLLATTPAERTRHILADAGVGLCLVDDNSGIMLRRLGLDDINFSTCAQLEQPISVAESVTGPFGPAYVIYTSGTTGQPKGVVVTHRNIVANIRALSNIYPIGEDAAMLQACSHAFDVSVFEIFWTWANSMRLCSATHDTLFSDLEAVINYLGVTHLSLTPTVASVLERSKVPHVRFLVTAGEKATAPLLDAWRDIYYQGYGPCEATNVCTAIAMRDVSNPQYLGPALANTSAFVMHPNSQQIVVKGAVGELVFGGDQIAEGYLNLAQATADKFIDHATYGRLYRTGDSGRMMPDGGLIISGRLDGQVKLRGQRVELQEVDIAATASPLVRDSATVLVSVAGSEQLATFYVPARRKDDHESNDRLAIYRHLKSRLTHFMLPSYLLPLSSLPQTSSGKIDKAQLRQKHAALSSKELHSYAVDANADTESDTSTWTDLERQIAEIVTTSLNADRAAIGKWTPLATLGLDSISAISVARELTALIGRKVLVSTVLQNLSVGHLAAVLEDSASTAVTTDQVFSLDVFSSKTTDKVHADFEAAGHKVVRILPCTPLQEAMLTSANVNSMLFTLHAEITSIKSAWREMKNRHQILRTCFAATSERYAIAQVVLQDDSIEVLEYQVGEQTLEQCIEAHAGSMGDPIDSLQCPWSLAVIEDHGKKQHLSFICHHALYDGVAVNRLLNEIEMLVRGSQLTAPPSVESYLSQALDLPQSTEKFWTGHFAKFQPTVFPQSKHAVSSGTTVKILTAGMPGKLEFIQEATKRQNTTLLSVCQASWAVSLAIFTGSDDICFGNVMNGRTIPVVGIENLVFPCFNTIPIRVAFDSSGLDLYADLLRYLHTLNPSMLNHQFTPLRAIQAACGATGKLFDTLLLVQQPAAEHDANIWTITRDDGIMDVPLVCEVVPNAGSGQLTVNLHYHTSLVTDATAAKVLEVFQLAFSTALQQPQTRVQRTTARLPSPLADAIINLGLQPRSQQTDGKKSPSETTTLVDDDAGWSPVEMDVRAVFAEFASCPLDRIARDTSIYRLGLDSIAAVQIAAALRGRGYAGVTATDVIETRTCATLAALVVEKRNTKSQNHEAVSGGEENKKQDEPTVSRFWDAVPPEVRHDALVDCVPCTPLQEGIINECASSNGSLYLNSITLCFHDGITADRAEHALRQMVVAQPMLRCGFVQVVNRRHNYAMLLYKPNGVDVPVKVYPSNHEFELEQWTKDVRQRVIDDLHMPPWAVAVRSDDSGKLFLHLLIHHALYDAYSLELMLQTLASYLGGSAANQSIDIVSAVAHLLAQYQATEGHKDFWTGLADKAVVNKFPVLTPLVELYPSTKVFKQSIDNFQRIKLAAQKANTTIQAAMLAAWARILAAYQGEPAITFGVVLSGRTNDTVVNAPFPCINTLPVVAQHSANNRELLEQMLSYSASIQRHQYSRLSQIQTWLGRPGSALFDTIVAYQKIDASTESTPRKPFDITNEAAAAEYAVSLELIPVSEDELEVQLTFNTGVVPPAAAEIVVAQFISVFEHLLLSPDGHEAELHHNKPNNFSIVPPETRELGEGSDIEFLHHFVEKSALQYPDKVALEFVHELDPLDHQTWTFKQLDTLGNSAAQLISQTTGPGEIIGVCFAKCPEAYFSILGVLKAGCSFVALDPDAPAARKEYILSDSGAALLLCSDPATIGFDSPVPTVAVCEEVLRQLPEAPPVLSRALTREDRSYCLYTSGTTGTPKGCELTHRNAVQALFAFRRLFASRTTADSKCLQFASLHFDVAVLEQYWTWSEGLVLVAARRELVMDDVAGTINGLGITHIDLTPSLAQLLTPDMVPGLCRGIFTTGGESLRQVILDAWGDVGAVYNAYGPTEATIGVTMFPGVPRNGRPSNIGWCFANVGAFVLRPNTEEPVMRHAVGELCVSGPLVGKGYLKRAELTEQKFPTLQPWGERVYRTGDLVRLLHDGSIDFVGRADDQVKLRGQRLEIGEIDHVIKTATGVRDVATLVAKTRGDKQVLVSFVVSSDMQEQQQRQGRKTPSPSPSGAIELIVNDYTVEVSRRVLHACRTSLPAYMVPSYVLHLSNAIPLNTNNKADVKALRARFEAMTGEELLTVVGEGTLSSESTGNPNGARAVNSATFKCIVAVLHAENFIDASTPVSGAASVFDLGLDSISVTRLARALKASHFSTASTSMILRNPVLADLAEALDHHHPSTQVAGHLHTNDIADDRSDDAADLVATRHQIEELQRTSRSSLAAALGVAPEDIERIAPCSPLQQGMISRALEATATSSDASSVPYYHTFWLELIADIDMDKLKAAWDRVVAASPILRTRFVATEDGHIQVALAARAVEPLWKGVYVLPVADDDEAAETTTALAAALRRRWVMRNSGGGVETTGGSMVEPAQVRVFTVQRGRGRQSSRSLMVINMFHALYDGASLALVLRHLRVETLLLNHALHPLHDNRRIKLDTSYGPDYYDVLPLGPLRPSRGARSFWQGIFGKAGHIARTVQMPVLRAGKESGKLDTRSAVRRKVQVTREALDFGPVKRAGAKFGVAQLAVVQAVWTSVLRSVYEAQKQAVTKEKEYDGAVQGADDNGSESENVIFGLVVSGRALDLDGAEEIVGPLFNTVPFTVGSMMKSKEQQMRWDGLIKGCHELNTAMLPFQHTPLRDIQKWCNAGKSMFDVLLTFQREPPPDGGRELWRELPEYERNEDTELDYALAAEVTALANGRDMKVVLVGRGDVVDAMALETIAARLEAVVRSLDGERIAALDDGNHSLVSLAGITTQGNHSNNDLNDLDCTHIGTFEWNDTAQAIRTEIAALAEVKEEAIQASTSIMELGLDSIDAIKLAARLKKRGIGISRSALLRLRCIRNMVVAVAAPPNSATTASASTNALAQIRHVTETAQQGEDFGALCDRLRASVLAAGHDLSAGQTVLPPMPLQDAMVAGMLSSGFVNYFHQSTFALATDIDLSRFAEAWRKVIARNPILRTTFVPLGHEVDRFGFAQIVTADDPDTTAAMVDERELTSHAKLKAVAAQARERAEQLAGRGGLLQVTIAKVVVANTKVEPYLVVSMAHALYDGWSLDMMYADVETEYWGAKETRPEYRDYLAHMLEMGSGNGPLRFWKEYLRGVVPSIFLPRSDRDITGTDVGVTRAQTTSRVTAQQARGFCRSQGITLQSLGQATWSLVLARKMRRLDVVFGTVLSGRTDEAAERMMFPTMNTVATRALVPTGGGGYGSAADFTRHVQDISSKISEWEFTPLSVAVRAAGVDGELFGSIFLMQRSAEPAMKEGRHSLMCVKEEEEQDSSAEHGGVEYAVALEMEVVGEEVVWRIATRRAYFDKQGTQQLLDALNDTIDFIVNKPEEQLVRFYSGGLMSVCGTDAFMNASDKAKSAGSKDAPVDSTHRTSNEDNDDDSWDDKASTVRRVLATVAGIPIHAVKKHHTLYHLGLDSIVSIKASALLRNEGLRLRVRDMAGAVTVDTMAARATYIPSTSPPSSSKPSTTSQLTLSPSSDSSCTITGSPPPGKRLNKLLRAWHPELLSSVSACNDVLPATPLQVHMLCVWQQSQGRLFFPEFTFILRDLDPPAVASACVRLLHDLPILRTTLATTAFAGNNDKEKGQDDDDDDDSDLDMAIVALQLVRPASDVTSSNEHDGSTTTTITLRPNKFLPSLVYITVEPQSTIGTRLCLRLHHALYDGVSLPLIVSRIKTMASTNPYTSPSSPQQREQQRAWHAFSWAPHHAKTRAARRAFWTHYLAGCTADTTVASPVQQSSEQKRHQQERGANFHPGLLPPHVVTALRAAAATEGVGLHAVLIAAVARALSIADAELGTDANTSGQDILGIYLANRASAASNATINKHDHTHKKDHVDSDHDHDHDYDYTQLPYPTLTLLPLRIPPQIQVQQRSIQASLLVAAARTMQNDITMLTSPDLGSAATASLWEIQRWTGVQVHRFVNFLGTFDHEDMDADTEDTAVEANEANNDKEREKRKHVEAYGALEAQKPGVSWQDGHQAVRAAYTANALDVEIAVRGGSVDLGVFGPQEEVDKYGELVLRRFVEVVDSTVVAAEDRKED